jgi:hypothetical protein
MVKLVRGIERVEKRGTNWYSSLHSFWLSWASYYDYNVEFGKP